MCKNAFVPSGTAQRRAQMALEQAQAAQFAESQRVAAEQAARAEQAERQRQQNIQAGIGSIDQAFGQFNDPFFDAQRQAFMQANTPQLDEQYARARDELTALLAGRGTLESTVGADQFGQLENRFQTARGDLANRALEFVSGIRGRVNDTRNNLLTMVNAGGDPSGIAARAAGEATTLARTATQVPTQPLGSVFGAALQAGLPALQGGGTGAPRVQARGVTPTLPTGGGSLNVVS